MNEKNIGAISLAVTAATVILGIISGYVNNKAMELAVQKYVNETTSK